MKVRAGKHKRTSEAGIEGRVGDRAIVLDDLGRSFGSREVVNELSLSVPPGEIYGFLGPNGAGKSTTVRMLCTLLKPSVGMASVAGFDVARQPDQVRLHIGAALQEASLDPIQTGVQILRLQGRLYGLKPNEVDRRLVELATLIDLGDALNSPIKTYSGGMKRRLDLAAALIHNPQVLFLDEPTAGLDPISRANIWDEVRRLNRELGVTVFLTTQYLEEADELADRVGIIDNGKLVAEGTPDELKYRVGEDLIIARIAGPAEQASRVLLSIDSVSEVEVSTEELVIKTAGGASTIGPVAIALGQASIEIKDLTLRTATLDDVFLELTGSRIQAGEQQNKDLARQELYTIEEPAL